MTEMFQGLKPAHKVKCFKPTHERRSSIFLVRLP